MDDEDTTLLELDPDPTPVHDAFDLMATIFTRKVQALRTVASHVQTMTPIACHYLALALGDILETGHDLHRLLTVMASTG